MLYHLAYWILYPLFKLLYRLEIIKKGNLPSRGPVILASNHKSYLDPIILGLACFPRPVSFMAKVELFQIPLLRTLIKRLYAFPVKRGESDRDAFRKALECLSKGWIVGIFPEGTRVRERRLGSFHPGFALLSLKSGAIILPIAIMGTERIILNGKLVPRFPKIKVIFGQPFSSTEVNAPDKRSKIKKIIERSEKEILKILVKEDGNSNS